MPASRNVLQSRWVIALSALAVGALAAPVLGPAIRPIVRGAVKAGILTQRRLTTVVAGLREELEDVVAEAKDELGAEPETPTHPHDHAPHGAA